MTAVRKLIAALLILAALAVAVFGAGLSGQAMRAVPYIEGGAEGSAEALEDFFACLKAQDWPGAYGHLYNYASLGLEDAPSDELSAMFWRAQLAAWDFQVEDGYSLSGTHVTRQVRVRCLDLDAVSAEIGARVQTLLAERVEQARLRSEVYDETGAYREDVAYAALYASTESVLADPAPFFRDRDLSLNLTFVDGEWLVEADSAFISALTSGAVRR